MDNGKKAAAGITAILIALLGVRVWFAYRAHTDTGGPSPTQTVDEPKLNDDDAVYPRKLRPDSLKDERDLIGKTIWVSAGGQLDYYKDTGKHVDYTRPVDTLKAATPLEIKDAFEQVPPKSGRAVFRIPAGQKQVLLAFTMPNSPDPKQLYATPVGYYENGAYTFFTDDIMFYDDPHQLYRHWGPAVWAHVDKHEVVPGMTENQCMMALGQVLKPSSDDAGNRAITFDNDGHPIDVEFQNNKATTITPEKQ